MLLIHVPNQTVKELLQFHTACHLEPLRFTPNGSSINPSHSVWVNLSKSKDPDHGLDKNDFGTNLTVFVNGKLTKR